MMELIALTVYVILNLVSFGMFLSDKAKAQKGEWRTKESTLILSALFGPFGAALGMRVARHKTQKLKFKLVYVFLALHIVVLAGLLVL